MPADETKFDNVYEGALYIDTERGVVSFLSRDGQRLLRVTHLPAPIPDNILIDLVAIRNVTSYTPVQGQEQAPPIGPRRHKS